MGRTHGSIGCVYQKKKQGQYYATYQLKRKRVTRATGKLNKPAAEKILEKLIGEHQARMAQGSAGYDPKFEEMYDRLRDFYRNNDRRSIRMLDIRYNHLEPFFRGLRASQFGARLRSYRTLRLSQVSPKTKRKYSLATVKLELAALRFAMVLSGVPLPHFERIQLNNARQQSYSRADLERVLVALPEYLRRLVVCYYITGWRLEELLSRQWPDIDVYNARLWLDAASCKTNDPRFWPLRPDSWLTETLREQRAFVTRIEHEREIKIAWIFCRDDGTRIRWFPYPLWRKVVASVGLAGSYIHDFRRSASSNSTRVRHTNEKVAMQLIGHKSVTQHQKYQQPNRDDIDDFADQLDEVHKRDAAALLRQNQHLEDFACSQGQLGATSMLPKHDLERR
ncbi:MAG TPA: tyrosine-type recombinase/integrase [Scandinavium sp.]|jgi:integrase|uniref:tyrosine-type recombinase/integrase n=1 Tax=Scandinavium sp. TaxID=2830653 RepID=UPI002E2ECFB7|nr:tyrosine-type recombinase/integrase [Scandinavium sp.]HEX4499815.1 tyrosine-type recombinase/integrase [Scandinavium sp.]